MKKILILGGGISKERKISLETAKQVNKVLKRDFKTVICEPNNDLIQKIKTFKPDLIFNALHGRFGEDGCVQGLLNILDVPYTHSGVIASALAMDKPMAKRLMSYVGIKVAEHRIVTREELDNGDVIGAPYVVKPLNEGSSVGVYIVHEGDKFRPSVAEWGYGERVMVEKYIAGRELTVAVMGDRALAVTEIDTWHQFYDYDAKYVKGGSKHQIPADLPSGVYKEAMRISLLAHETLGCRGVSRADIRYDGTDLYMLELNTQPGMTPTSLVPEQAAYVNISFENLVSWMVEHAACDG